MTDWKASWRELWENDRLSILRATYNGERLWDDDKLSIIIDNKWTCVLLFDKLLSIGEENMRKLILAPPTQDRLAPGNPDVIRGWYTKTNDHKWLDKNGYFEPLDQFG